MIPLNSALARVLVRGFIWLRISANTITSLSLLSGLLGAWYLSMASPPTAVYGAAFFLLSCVLDECDGKVARETNTCSRLGAFLDVMTDGIVHVLFFIGLGFGLERQFPQHHLLLLGWIAGAGVALSSLLDVTGISTWNPPSHSAQPCEDRVEWMKQWFQVDFSVIVLISAVLHHTVWILWAGALGVFLAWIPSTVFVAVAVRKAKQRRPA